MTNERGEQPSPDDIGLRDRLQTQDLAEVTPESQEGTPETIAQERAKDTIEKKEPEIKEPEPELDQKEYRRRLDGIFDNAKKSVADLARIGRELFEEQAARLGFKSERIRELEQQSGLDREIRDLQEQNALEVRRIINKWSEKIKDPDYLAKKQREDSEWSNWLDSGLKWANPNELSPAEKETTVAGAIGRALEGADGRVLFHATSKDRLPPDQELQLNKDFSLQAVKPLERYFSSSRGEQAVEPYVVRVISRNREVTQTRTGEFGEYGMDAGQELVRLPVPPEKRERANGQTYEVHTYIPKAELAGNELELVTKAEPNERLAQQISAREKAIKAEYDKTKAA
ncbi:MAG: hypothetical protein Q8P33_01605 [bacterium]|nr:hypothetical protein [bacterium]